MVADARRLEEVQAEAAAAAAAEQLEDALGLVEVPLLRVEAAVAASTWLLLQLAGRGEGFKTV